MTRHDAIAIHAMAPLVRPATPNGVVCSYPIGWKTRAWRPKETTVMEYSPTGLARFLRGRDRVKHRESGACRALKRWYGTRHDHGTPSGRYAAARDAGWESADLMTLDVGARALHLEIIVLCGFSGHGFKLAPLMGDIAADFILEGRTERAVEHLLPHRLLTAVQH